MSTRPPADPDARKTADDFDWSLVRSFLAVLEAGSLSAAARRLQAHQPTLSRHVAELEAQLDGPLFERTGRGVAPTALALSIAESARQMRSGADALSRRLGARTPPAGGTVRVSTSDVAATYLLPSIIARLIEAEPGLQIEIVATNAISNLLRREADIAVRMARPEQASLIARRLGAIGVGAYAHASYLRRAGMPVVPADLLDHRLIGMDADASIVRGFAAQGMRLARAQFVVRTDDHRSHVALVAAGAGIGFLTHYVAAQLPELRRVLPGIPVPSLPCWLAVHREIRTNRLVRRVFDHLAVAVPAAIAIGG